MASFSTLFRSEWKLFFDNVYCIYLVMSKIPKELPNCLKEQKHATIWDMFYCNEECSDTYSYKFIMSEQTNTFLSSTFLSSKFWISDKYFSQPKLLLYNETLEKTEVTIKNGHQRHWQHWLQKTQDEDKQSNRHNTIQHTSQ